MPQPSVFIRDIGTIAYAEAWELQKRTHAEVVAGGPSTLLFCHHPPVYTRGTRTQATSVPHPESYYRTLGAEVFTTDRGGDVTFHGPGQLVGYPIFRLEDFPCGKDLHRFLRAIEESLIVALGRFGLSAGRNEGKTGVWVEGTKVAAIGMRCSRWVSMHGFAFNVSTDLSWFSHIVPCGLSEPVSSLQSLLDESPDMNQVKQFVRESMAKVFACSFSESEAEGDQA